MKGNQMLLDKHNIKEFIFPKKPLAKEYLYTSEIVDFASPKHPIKTLFSRKIELHYLGWVQKKYMIQFLTLDYYAEGRLLNNYELTKRIGYLFDDIVLSVDSQFSIIEVNNILGLRLRWKDIKQKILEDFSGNELTNYLITIDNLLKNEKELITFFMENKMLGLFFNGMIPAKEDVFIKESGTTKEFVEITKKTQGGGIIEYYLYENFVILDAFSEFKIEEKKEKYKLMALGLRNSSN